MAVACLSLKSGKHTPNSCKSEFVSRIFAKNFSGVADEDLVIKLE